MREGSRKRIDISRLSMEFRKKIAQELYVKAAKTTMREREVRYNKLGHMMWDNKRDFITENSFEDICKAINPETKEIFHRIVVAEERTRDIFKELGDE